MAAPRKTAGMLNFERQLDAAFPHRKKPDGWVGNEAHKGHTSDHNADDTPGSKPGWDGDPDNIPDVRAIDVWFDLGDGYDCVDLLNHLIHVPAIGAIFRYFILRGKIYHVHTGFKAEAYDGDFHGDHLHGTFAWTEAADNNSSFDFRLEEITMDEKSIAAAVWGFDLEDPVTHQPKNASAFQRYNDFVTTAAADRVIAALKPQLDAIAKALEAK